MKTPEQIRNMEFQKSPMGGYKQSDVELFLEEMAIPPKRKRQK